MTGMPDQQMNGDESPPLPEFRPPSHPYVLFRAHSGEGRHSILYLGGEEYWVDGMWMAQAGSRMVVLRDRLFRISELVNILPGVGFSQEPALLGPSVSS